MNRRGIKDTTYQNFAQVKVGKDQAVFGLYRDFDTQPRLCSTISYSFNRDGERQKYFQKNLPRGLAKLEQEEK